MGYFRRNICGFLLVLAASLVFVSADAVAARDENKL